MEYWRWNSGDGREVVKRSADDVSGARTVDPQGLRMMQTNRQTDKQINRQTDGS